MKGRLHESYMNTCADKFVSSGPPPQPTTRMSNVVVDIREATAR
jgi:hypothetical protein